jgi:hypothetical protein
MRPIYPGPTEKRRNMTANSEPLPSNGNHIRWTSADGSSSRFTPRKVTRKRSFEDHNPQAALIESLIAAIAITALIIALVGVVSTPTPSRPGVKLQTFTERPIATQGKDGKL